MSYRGIVKNGVIVLDGPQILPEGACVEINYPTSDAAGSTLGQRLQQLAGIAKGLPEDMAENHDHYIHGRQKK